MGFKENVSVTLDINANIAQVRSAAKELQSILSKTTFAPGVTSGLEKMVSGLNSALSELETKSSKSLKSLGDTKGIENSIEKVQNYINSIVGELQRLDNTGSNNGFIKMVDGLAGKMTAATQAQKQYTQAIKETEQEANKLAKALENAEAKDKAARSALETKRSSLISAQGTERRKQETYDSRRQILQTKRQEELAAEQAVKQARSRLASFREENRITDDKINDDGSLKISKGTVQQYDQLRAQLAEVESAYAKAGEAAKKAQANMEAAKSDLDDATAQKDIKQGQYDEAAKKVQQATAAAAQAQEQHTQAIKESEQEAEKLAKTLERAQAKEKSAQSALATKESALITAQGNVRKKQQDYESKQQILKTKQQEELAAEQAAKQIRSKLASFREENGITDDKINSNGSLKINSDIIQQYDQLRAQLASVEEAYVKTGEAAQKAQANMEAAKSDLDDATAQKDIKQGQYDEAAKEAEQMAANLQQAQKAVQDFNASARDTSAFKQFKQAIAEAFGEEVVEGATNVDELSQRIEQFATKAGGEVSQGINQMLTTLQKTSPVMMDAGDKARKAGDGFKQMSDKAQDLDMLTYRLKYFFSMVGGFQLLRRAIRSGIETIKELDAAMTQTAVVSTKTIGQMWKTLPEYTQKAKALAASIKDVYSAQTLYVQQGLDMDSALELGVETLKMARVAGIEAAAATDSMTAALRGFKMELNETSAVRINDVYSKLAQNTASNVQEISTAMTKVAALANSANMSFENTAAFLSKIIESTREGAETAGTALKTVIARFTEVKTLYDQGELTGTDEEGQEVDVNKISKALRTAGINMNEFFTGAKGLDEIFIELGKKWDSLTTIQQRYIATQAAGSRQQSRFLALMQDFSRTTELTSMAYNAAGSGQEQFEKTLESLDAKLTKLKTEWQNFIMGIANSDLVKGVIDFGSKLLETLNNIIDKLSGGNGLAKSILSVATAFGVFKIGGMAVRGILNNIGVALGTKSVGTVGIGAGLSNIKQNFKTLPSLMPTIGKFNGQTGEWKGINKQGRLNRINAINLAQAHDQGVLQARAAQEAYNTESVKLAKMQTPQARQAYIDNAIKTGEASGKEQANKQYDTLIQTQQEKVGKSQKNLTEAQDKVSNTAGQQTAQLQAYGSALQGIGMAAGIAAGALFLLSNKLEQSKKYQTLAKVVKGLAIGLSVLSVSFMLLGTAAQIAGAMVAAGAKTAATAIKSIPIIGWILAIISAIISLISIIVELTKQKPPEEVWKEYEEACEKAADSAEKFKDSYKNALNQVKDISAQEAKLDELTIGTEEWDTAVKNLNDSILELIQTYPALAEAIKWVNDHWILDVTSDAYKKWVQDLKFTAAASEIVFQSTTIGKNRVKAWNNYKEWLNDQDIYKYTNGKKHLGTALLNGELGIMQISPNSAISDYYDYDKIKTNGYWTSRGKSGAIEHTYSKIDSGNSPLIHLFGGAGAYVNEVSGPGGTFYKKTNNIEQFKFGKGITKEQYDLLTDYFFNNSQYKHLPSNYQAYGGNNFYDYGKSIGLDYETISAFVNAYTNLYNYKHDTPYNEVSQIIDDSEKSYYKAQLEPLYTNLTLDIIDEAYTKLAPVVSEGINEGIIINLPTLDTYLSDYFNSGEGNTYFNKYGEDTGKNLYKYFHYLFTDENGNWDSNVPIIELLENYRDIQEANKDIVNKSATYRSNYISEVLKIDPEDKNLYMKFGEKNYRRNFLSLEDDDELYKQRLNKQRGSEYSYEQNFQRLTGLKPEDDAYKEVLTEYLRFAIATEKTYSDNYFQKFDKWYKNLDKDTKEVARNLMTNDNKNLSIDFLKNSQEYLDKLGEYFEEYYDGIPIETLIKKYNEMYEGLDVNIKNTIEDLATTWEQASNLVFGVNRSNAVQQGNGQKFLDNISKIYELINNNQKVDKEKARNILESIDWTNTDSINQAVRELSKLGVTIDQILVKDISDATGAISKFNVKTLQEKVEQLETAKTVGEKIKNGEMTISAKEYEAIYNTAAQYYNSSEENRNWNNDWVQVGLDKWVYIGNQTNSLLASINMGVLGLLNNSIDETKEEIKKGQEIGEKIDNKKTKEGYSLYYSDEEGLKTTNSYAEYGKIISNATNGEIFYQDEKSSTSLRSFAINSGALNSDQIDSMTDAQIFSAVQYFLQSWVNLPENIGKLESTEALRTAILAQNTSEQELLNNKTNSDNAQDVGKILQGRVTDQGLLYTVESMQANAITTDEETGEKIAANYDEEELKETKDLYNALALTSKKTADNIDNLNSVLNDNWKTFTEAEEGTAAYNNALNKMIPAFKKVFGDEVDSQWIKEHKEKIDAIVEGGEAAEEAFESIRQEQSDKAFSKLGDIVGLTADQLAGVQAIWNQLDGSQLEVGGTFDATNLIAGLNLSQEAAAGLAAYINSIAGMSANVEEFTDANGNPGFRVVINKTGASGSGLPTKGGGGGGGKEFKNDFDKYYNQVEDINELIRLRNLLETDYNQLLEAEGTSGKQIYDNLKKQVDLLKERQKLTADLAEKRKGQIFDLLNDKEYKDVKQYAWWNEEDQTIEIDWDAINKIKDSKTGDKIKELVQKLEDFQSKYDEQIEALEEIEDALEDIRKRGRDEYISLEERLRDALIAKIQEQIDEQSATNEAIDTANSNLMDSIQKALEQQRQERENAKTEEELADKEQRLAYLQQDSSGANAVEIAQLQKELDEARENYTDQLIDQKISELQEQNDEAAQQRQEQIDLMQQSLDWQEKNGEFWEQAYQILEQSIGPDGSLLKGSELEQLLKSSDAWQGLSAEGKMKWLEELEKMVAQATGYLSLSRQLEDIGTKAGEKITFTNAEGKTLTGVVDENGNVVVTDKNGNKITYKDVYQDYFGKYHTLESEKDANTESKPTTSSPQSQESGSSPDTSPKYTGSDYEYINDQTCMEHKHYSDGSTKNSAGGHNIVNEVCKKCGHSFKKKTGGGCFAAGTKIIMSDFTTKNIEDVLIGDEVIAYNEEKELFEFKKVTKSYKHYNTPRVIKVILSNNVVLKITPGHPILTTEGWKSRDIENSLYEHNTIATWLNIGDQVIGYSGIVVVENIVEMEIPNNYITYNIEVEVCHTYLADGIVVHNMKMYATGGLNTETGPAWLDGTPSHPELVLNARDTENFIQLKDTLADLRKNSGSLGINGDNYYEISINVDEIGSDYDVDKLADRLRTLIYRDGQYRNVNTLNRLR